MVEQAEAITVGVTAGGRHAEEACRTASFARGWPPATVNEAGVGVAAVELYLGAGIALDAYAPQVKVSRSRKRRVR